MNTFTGRLGVNISMPGNVQLGVSTYVLNPLSAIVTQTLPFTQQITLTRVFVKNVSDTLALIQNTDLDVRSHVILDAYNRCVDQELIFDENIIFTIIRVINITIAQFLDIQEPCVLVDSEHHPRIHYRSIEQSLLLSQTVHGATGIIYVKDIDQTLSLSQNIVQSILPIYTISQTLPFTQSITKTKGNLISKSISNSLAFTETIVPEYVVLRHVIYRELYQTLVLTDSLFQSKLFNIRIPQRLEFIDTTNINRVVSYSFQDILEFSNDRSLALNARTILTIPSITFVRVPKAIQPVTYMFGAHSDIYLPQPNYDDSEALNHVVNVNRSMTGVPYTYVKKSRSRTLTYSFSVNRLKAQELGSFYLRNAADPIRLVTHDNKLYIGFITSEPLVYTQARTNVNDVEITFEGIPY